MTADRTRPSVNRGHLTSVFSGQVTSALTSLQIHAHGTACADAQVSTVRERLFKLAAWVERSARRIVLHLPRPYAWLTAWRQLALRVGAAPA